MNYFERLLRRALLLPATTPGAALDDPFATVAAWPLEPPASKPAPDVGAPVVAPKIEPVTARSSPLIEHPTFATAQELTARPACEASYGPPAAPLSPSAETPRETVHTQAGVTEPSPAAIPIMPQQHTLAIADAFMGSLGVKSQLPELAPATPPEAPVVQATVAMAQEGEPSAAPSSAQIVPPTSALPVLVSRPSKLAASKLDVTAQASSRERSHETSTFAKTVVAERHILVERSSVGAAANEGVPGGGAPRFGLGQL